MRTLSTALTLIFSVVNFISFGQFRQNQSAGFTFSVQVDSSRFYIIGGQPGKADRVKYPPEERSGSYLYSGESQLWTNAYIYNDSTGKLIKLFDQPLIGVFPAFNMNQIAKYDYFYNPRNVMSGVTKDHILFAVKTDSYNKDGVIDAEDPVYLYICKKDGTGLRQINPDGMSVTNWRLVKNGMGIIVTCQQDKNADKKFTEDEELFQADLNTDVSKIVLKPIVITK